jgi:hypothetical protein
MYTYLPVTLTHFGLSAQEAQLIEVMKARNQEREQTLKEEPAGIDAVLVQGGFNIPMASAEASGDAVLDNNTEQTVSFSKRPGYDLVRVCNIDEFPQTEPQEIAFFHHRGTLGQFDEERQEFIRQCCGVLRQVAKCFGYEPYYITLFYQAHSVSRFIR